MTFPSKGHYGCLDCPDTWVHARGRCDTCYRRARASGALELVVTRVGEDEANKMREMRKLGFTLWEIAAATERSYSSVLRRVGRGTGTGRRRRRKANENV